MISGIHGAHNKNATITLAGSTIYTNNRNVELNGNTATITAGGTYSITGTLSNGQIIIDSDDSNSVNLILNSATIINTTGTPLFISNAANTIITLTTGTTNVLTDGSSYVFADGEDEPSAALYSQDALTINGTGTLQVNANYKNGITSKDTLTITSGTIAVNAENHALKGKDTITFNGGTLTLYASEDSINAGGDITINDGTFALSCDDDAIHSDAGISITGGTIDISKSNEGIEGTVIDITAGDISIVASDDGLNAAGDEDSSPDYAINISGGDIAIYADGDGIDSNGSITMSGGTVLIHGPTASDNGAIDSDYGFSMVDGTLIGAASKGMLEAPDSESSSQYAVTVTLESSLSANTLFHVESTDGTELFTFAPAKSYQSVIFSLPTLTNGTTYRIYRSGSSTGTKTNGLYSGGTYTPGTLLTTFTISDRITTIKL